MADRWDAFTYAELIAIGVALEQLNTFYASFGVVRQARRLRRELVGITEAREKSTEGVPA